MIEFQIGKAGLKNAARESFVFGAIFVTAVDVTDYFMRDSATLGELVGNVGMDIAKVAVASAAGYAVGALIVGTVVGTFAIGPPVVAFGAAVIVGYVLGNANEYFGISERLSKALDATFGAIDRLVREGEAEAKAWMKQIETSTTVVDLSRSVENWWNRAARWSSNMNWKYGMAGGSFHGI